MRSLLNICVVLFLMVFGVITSAVAWTVEDAVGQIDELAGSHFDPSLIPLFHAQLPEILEIKARYAEDAAPRLGTLAP